LNISRNFEQAQKQMGKLSKGLQSVDEKVAELRAAFESSTREATQIKIDLDRELEIINSASTLVTRLEGEYQRWKAQVS
jgi:dynein heavy chain 2